MEEKIITPSVPTIEYVVVDGAKYEILTDKDREALKRLDKNAVEEVMVAGGTAMRNGHTVQITGLQTKLKPGQGIDVDEEGNIVCTLDSQLYEMHTETKPTGVPEHVNRIHLFPMEVSIEGGSNRFAEYIYLTDEKRWEKLGEIDTKFKVTLDVNSLADLDKFNTDKDSGCYVVRLKRGKDFFSIGTIDIFADSMRHVVYQVFETSEDTSGGQITGGHTDGVLHKWERVYNISSPSMAAETKGKWSTWSDRTQKEIEEVKMQGSDLQTQINKIVAKNASVYVSVKPSVIYKGVSTPIQITATVSGLDGDNVKETDMSIQKGVTVLKSVQGVFSISHNTSCSATTTFAGVADYRGLKISNTRTVYAEYPIYVGWGKAYTDVAVEKFKQEPKTSPRGDYDIRPSDGDNVFMIVPSSMSISGVNLGLLNYPYKQDENRTINGITYKVYSSVEKTSNKPFTITIK